MAPVRAQTAAAPTGPVLGAPPLVGREVELALLQGSRRASAELVLVEGEAGVGKTRLVREWLGPPGREREGVCVATCLPVRARPPLAPIMGALHSGGLTRGGVAPAIAWSEPEGMLGALAGHGVRLLLVEDAQWADEPTLEFLLRVASADPMPIGLAVTYRPEDVPGRSLLWHLTSRQPPGGALTRVSVRPLDLGGVAELASALLGGGPVSEHFAGLLRQASGGLPGAVAECVGMLSAPARAAAREPGNRALTLEDLPVPPSIRDRFARRWADLSGAAQHVLVAAALLDAPVSARELCTAAGVAEEAGSEAIGELMDAAVLREPSLGQVTVRRVAEARAVCQVAPPSLMRETHARAGRMLQHSGHASPASVSRHLERAGLVEEWQQSLSAAATKAVDDGDEPVALDLLTQLLLGPVLMPDLAVRAIRLLSCMTISAVRHGGRRTELIAGLERLLSTVPLATAQAAWARVQLARALMAEWRNEEGRRQLELAAEDLSGIELRRAVTLLSWPRGATWSAVKAREWLSRVDPGVDPQSEDRERGPYALLVDEITVRLMLGDQTGWRLAELVPDTGVPDSELPEICRANLNLGNESMRWGRYQDAEGHYQSAERLARTHGYSALDAACAGGRLHLDYFLGRWDGLKERAEALSGDSQIQLGPRIEAALVLGRIAAAGGARHDAEAQLRWAVEQAVAVGALEILAESSGALAALLLLAGRGEDALASTQGPADLLVSNQLWNWFVDLAPAHVDALVLSERIPEATVFVESLLAGAGQVKSAALAATVETCQGASDEACGRYPQAARSFGSAAAKWGDLPRPYDALLARERAGHALLRADCDGDGLRELRAALDGLVELGAADAANRVARALRARGVTAHVPAWCGGPRGYGDRLSRRESEVVTLVVEGLTNKQIAERLSRSLSTIESQLTSAMRKLKVPSRTALAVAALRLSGQPQGAEDEPLDAFATPGRRQ